LNPLILQFLASLTWGVLVTPVSIFLARRFRVLDEPGGRKIHSGTVPRGAGIVLWLGHLLWVLLAGGPVPTSKMIAVGATLVFLVGYVDDMKQTSPYLRLGIHLLAAFIVVSSLSSAALTRALLILWIAGCTSAYNLIDGMDGLCLSLTIATAFLFCVSGQVLPWFPFAGLCLGVLFWNFPFPRARTFLGDGGSTLLGFLCASQMAGSIAKEGVDPFALMFVLALMGGIPVLDTLLAVSRRILRGRSPFLPDRGHLHHRLLDRSFPVPAIIVMMGTMHLALLVSGMTLLKWLS
jgi:UDP-GlcNAc:undecaprenyl-phosphate GlcNAc-1-phosphate transferase